ncbi:MAG: hypothetical protein IKH31_01455 [Clostridia bacterium]|jgi:hypothetical protein|nr:hypothetical protein [Clostridia bacterium]
MSRVRYVNKKTGWVSIYESISCYDPVKKTSRPKRIYIGYEDPVTKEFVPSSGRPGRKKKNQQDETAQEPVPENMQDVSYQEYRKVLDEVERLRTENNTLQEQLLIMKKQLSRIDSAVDAFIHSIQASRQ